MKKWMMLLLALVLCLPALAEDATLPVRLLEHEEAAIPLADALITAKNAVDKVPEQAMIRAELAEMTGGARTWIVTIFDTDTLLDAWCVMVDASNGAVVSLETAEAGFFNKAYSIWTAQKGPHALWSLADKQLYDALYAMLPVYGLPMSSDLPQDAALKKALFVVGLDSAEGYEVGCGYIMGGEGYNGVWEVCLVKNGQVAYRVNLDAVTGEVYYMEPDEAGNG